MDTKPLPFTDSNMLAVIHYTGNVVSLLARNHIYYHASQGRWRWTQYILRAWAAGMAPLDCANKLNACEFDDIPMLDVDQIERDFVRANLPPAALDAMVP